MLWECVDCGLLRASDPLGHSDWGGKVIIDGPRCPECECPMDCIANDGDTCPICGGSGGGVEGWQRCPYCVDGRVWRNGKENDHV